MPPAESPRGVTRLDDVHRPGWPPRWLRLLAERSIPPNRIGRSERRQCWSTRSPPRRVTEASRSRPELIPGVARSASSTPRSLDCSPVEMHSKDTLDLHGQLGAGARAFRAAQVGDQFGSQLERTAPASAFVEQTQHPPLLEVVYGQIKG